MGMSWSELYRETIRQLLNDKADDIATGSAQDFADYRHKTGVIEGLALAEREFLDIVERIERED
jgi:hypothetical protein